MARHTGGWVKLWRKAVLGDIGANYTRGGLFSTLIAMANIQESRVSWQGKPRELQRGQIATSLQELAELGETDRKTVLRHLTYLERRETITLEKSNYGTVITINNYEEYQGVDAVGGQQRGHGVDRGVPHNEELKNKRSSTPSAAKIQEARFRWAKEIEELKPILSSMFDGVLPKFMENKIPEILMAADGNVQTATTVLEDLFQSDKIRTGEGLNGTKASYVTAAICKRFGIGEAS